MLRNKKLTKKLKKDIYNIVITPKNKNLVYKMHKNLQSMTNSGESSCITLNCCSNGSGNGNIKYPLSVLKGGTGREVLIKNKFLVGNGLNGVLTTKTVPNGNVVGTTDEQTLKNKIINGNDNNFENINATSIGHGLIDNLTFNYLEGTTSNIQQQLNDIYVNMSPQIVTYNNIAMSSNITYYIIDRMYIQPTIGKYFVIFSCSLQIPNTNSVFNIALFLNDTIIQDSIRSINNITGQNTLYQDFQTQTLVEVSGSDIINVKCKSSSNQYSLIITQRNLILFK